MKKKIKKAFTLVELLVVIAILAILATVSIVGYNSFTKKAKVSNDTVLVKQMNDILIASKQTDEANPTMEDAISDVLDGGYDLDKLTPTTTNYNIVWDSINDQMVLLDENMNAVYPADVDMTKKYNYFTMISNEDEITSGKKVGFSHYLKGGFTSDGVIETSTGIDVGRNTNINEIKYTGNSNERNIIVHTDSFDTKITIDGVNDEVKHYGKAKEIDIIHVKMGTYTEYGNVLGNINLSNGKVKVETDGCVSNIIIKELTDSNNTIVKPEGDSDISIEINNSNVSTVGSTIANIKTNDVVCGTNANSVTKIDYFDSRYNNIEAIIGDKQYSSILDAFSNVKNGETVTLIKNINNKALTVEKEQEFTLNTNGFDIKANCTKLITIYGSLSILGTGTIECQDMPLYIYDGKCVLNGANVVATANKYSAAVFVEANALSDTALPTFIMNGGTITGTHYSLATNNVESSPSVAIINYGKLNGVLYWPSSGSLTIGKVGGNNNDVQIIGKNAMEVCCGTVIINCGTFIGTLADVKDSTLDMIKLYSTTSGSKSSGDAMTIVIGRSSGYSRYSLNVIINNGIFTYDGVENSLRILLCSNDQDATITINGGTYNGPIDYETAINYVHDNRN